MVHWKQSVETYLQIKMLDAMNKDKPIDGNHLFDGQNDSERRKQKSTRTYELWKNHFVAIQEEQSEPF